jgi:UDP-glucose 4-epimerase
MGKNILVTGGAGFIGSEIVRKLVKNNNNVTVLDNLSTGLLENLRDVYSDLNFVRGDIKDSELVKKLTRKKDVVYHMAAEVGVDRVMKKDTEVCEVDYLASLDLFNIASRADVGVFLFASSSEVYGKFPQDRLPMKEEDRFTPDTVYGWAKYGAELKLNEISQKNGMAGVSVRYFNVYGPKQTLNGYCVPSFVDASLKNRDIAIHGDGSQTRDLTYIDDAVRMTLSVADYKNKGKVFNIGTQTEVTMLDLAKIINRLAGAKSRIIFIEPRRPTDLYHKMGDAGEILRTSGVKSETSLDRGLIQCIEYSRNKLESKRPVVYRESGAEEMLREAE